MPKKTTYKKGIELEEKFAKYLKEKMGYTETKIRFQVKQANNSRGANIDVIGQKLSENGKTLKYAGIVYLILFLILFVIGIIVLNSDSNSDCGGYLIFISVVFEIFGVIGYFLGVKYSTVHIWVECKNLKNKVNINQVRKMVNEIKAYKDSGSKKYRFKEFAFVSASGFIDNAIELAIANNIKCFIVNKKNNFEQINEWSK